MEGLAALFLVGLDGLDLLVHHRALVDDIVDEDAIVPEVVYLPFSHWLRGGGEIPNSPFPGLPGDVILQRHPVGVLEGTVARQRQVRRDC